jgi:hypothetical protein
VEETQQLLSTWRTAEARFESIPEGTAEWHQARIAAEVARDAYRAHMAELADEAAELARLGPLPVTGSD